MTRRLSIEETRLVAQLRKAGLRTMRARGVRTLVAHMNPTAQKSLLDTAARTGLSTAEVLTQHWEATHVPKTGR